VCAHAQRACRNETNRYVARDQIVEGERRAVDGRLGEGRTWQFEFNR
jgi:hypothetical protein